jgi:alpha-ribazole phosphatase
MSADASQPALCGATAALAQGIDDEGSLWLVRHARPLIAAGICYGATDVQADAQGTAALARLLAQQVPTRARVRSSPLRRCSALAAVLARLRPDLQWQIDARLAEMNFGCWEGVAWADIPRDELDRWSREFATLQFGGVESAQQMLERVRAAWIESRRLPGCSVWLTHAGVIRCAGLLAQGSASITSADQWPAEPIGYGSVTRL